jgi:hypothetical protein
MATTINITNPHPRAIKALEIILHHHNLDYDIVADEWDEPRDFIVARNKPSLADDIEACGLMSFVSFDTTD